MTERLAIVAPTPRASLEEREERGRAARKATPRSAHGDWRPRPDRRDPVDLLDEQNRDRLDWLVPVRHARMRVSPFTFFRGAARVMAADLAGTPVSGEQVQLAGDAHLSNFGAYASPERRLVFDANDFDETLRGPWEWDLKRLVASFVIAAQHLGFSRADSRRVAGRGARSYREAMAAFAAKPYLETWYDHTPVRDLANDTSMPAAEVEDRLERFERRARSRNSLQAVRKLTTTVDGKLRIRNDPPVLLSLASVPEEADPDALEAAVRHALHTYAATLSDDRRWLLARYEVLDFGLKVVGVGSVGTRCVIALLRGRDDHDPLFLQAKEAGRSVLEEHLEPSPYENQGRRVVEGQRLMQAESDLFLGWTEGREHRSFYVRQLRDWKGSFEVEGSTPNQLDFYAGLCGRTLARGHARSGDPVAIAAYCGRGDALDRAMVEFGFAYAAQNLDDYEAFCTAIDDGRLPAA